MKLQEGRVADPIRFGIAQWIDGRRSPERVIAASGLAGEEGYYVLELMDREGLLEEGWREEGQRLAAAAVSVTGPWREEMIAALTRWGIGVTEDGDLSVVITPNYLDPALRNDGTWMLVNPFARVGVIGPLFRPGVTGCVRCLAQRLEENWRTLPWNWAGAGDVSANLEEAAAEIAQWILKGGGVEGALITYEPATGLKVRHELIRRPQCQACGCGVAGESVELEKLVSPVTGIVWQLSRQGGTHVAMLNGPLGSLYHRAGQQGRFLTASGRTRISCLAEGVERYSMCYDGTQPGRRARVSELEGRVVTPPELMHFSEAQKRSGRLQWLPRDWDEGVGLDWVEGWSLTAEETVWVPAAACYLDYYEGQDLQYVMADSNGCAAGETMEDALLAGLMELVERDAVALWWYNRVAAPVIETRGEIRVLDLTTDLGIAVCGAMAGNGLAGFGAGLTRDEAVGRAVGEVAQKMGIDGGGTEVPRGLKSALPQATETIGRRGLEVVAVNLTRQEIGVPVVRVIVPGLRHHFPRFGPGRLYDVPVELGWLKTPRLEHELNPVPPPL